MTSPRVSVIVPCFNREAYIGEAVKSILAQNLGDLEILVVDDGSTDASTDVVDSFDDPRVRLVRNERNLGIPATRNRGLDLARGDYIATLDSDELAEPGRLERQVAFLDARADIALVGSWAREVTEAGAATGKIKRRPTDPDEIDLWLLFRCAVLQYTMTGRAEVLRDYRYNEDLEVCEDHDLLLRLSADGHRLANLPEALVSHRVHDSQVTREKALRLIARKHAIVGRRLEELGVAHRPEDLERHFDLAHLRSRGIAPDAAYLDWAEDWLLRLIEAFARRDAAGAVTARRIGAELWLAACWHAKARLGPTRWIGRCFASPLAGPLWRSALVRLPVVRRNARAAGD